MSLARRTFCLCLCLHFLHLPGSLFAATEEETAKEQAILKYSELADSWYVDCVKTAQVLQKAVDALLKTPDQNTLKAAREAWLAARVPYRKAEAFRFYSGPVDDDDGLEHLLNSWPVDEAYLEQVPGSPVPGIIENTKDYPHLTTQLLDRLNQREGEHNITCGWHVIEFLLWGQDLQAHGCGDRPASDYDPAKTPTATRRGELLRLVTRKLVTDLEYLHEDWKPGKLGNYRAIWESSAASSFGNALTGITLLCEFELAGARLQVPYDTHEQEEEHSCFSDSTHLDHIGDLQGISEVWSLLKPVADLKDAPGAGVISKLIVVAQKNAAAIPVPFDQAILGEDTAPGRVAVKALIVAVEDLGQALRKLGETLELEIPETLEVVE